MSGDGKRSVAEWPKLPRPSSTLPNAASIFDTVTYRFLSDRYALAELRASCLSDDSRYRSLDQTTIVAPSAALGLRPGISAHGRKFVSVSIKPPQKFHQPIQISRRSDKSTTTRYDLRCTA